MLYDMLVARSDGQGQQTLDIIVLMNSFRAKAQDFGLKAPKNKHDSRLAFRCTLWPPRGGDGGVALWMPVAGGSADV